MDDYDSDVSVDEPINDKSIERLFISIKNGKPNLRLLENRNEKKKKTVQRIDTCPEYELGSDADNDDYNKVLSKGCKGVYDTKFYDDYRYLDKEFEDITSVKIEGKSCPECKSRDTVISEQIQLRSGDEGASVIDKCYKPGCGYTKLHK